MVVKKSRLLTNSIFSAWPLARWCLRPDVAETLIVETRYYSTREAAQRRLVEHAGRNAVDGENLQQLVVFGAGKRCAELTAHGGLLRDPELAAAQGPLRREHGYGHGPQPLILGAPGVLQLRVRAPARRRHAQDVRGGLEGDQGVARDGPLRRQAAVSADVYYGPDQSVFVLMCGGQECVREKLRLKHGPPGTKPWTSEVFRSFVHNALSPSFKHEPFGLGLSKGNPSEFGICLDFRSKFGHQTTNSEWDARWMTHGKEKPIEERVGFRSVYMNGPKEHRENDWPMIWYQPKVKPMLKDLK
ncbi:hypothetical protein DL771_002555 [Monosporascus sp. 5C6A]|nr:hypothetical protein DL771_002555 [Monosporascus sp. 5C6A]